MDFNNNWLIRWLYECRPTWGLYVLIKSWLCLLFLLIYKRFCYRVLSTQKRPWGIHLLKELLHGVAHLLIVKLKGKGRDCSAFCDPELILENRWAFGMLMPEDVFQHLINYNYNWTSDLKNLTARQLELTFTPSQCISLSILEQYI